MPDASALVSYPDYVAVTGDTASEDVGVVEDALGDALGLIQDCLGRTLPHGTYTETLKVYRNNLVYPSASPIDSVSSPNVDRVSIQGAGVYLGYYDPTPVVNYGDWNTGIPPQATITYTGGYTSETLPVKLKRALCRAAYNILHPAVLSNLPGGVTSVHVGDVGYSGGSLRTMDPLDDGIRSDIRGFRNPQFHGWQTSAAST